MQVLFSIVMALVTLGILVTIHEYGHYWVARRCGVRVLRFAVGFGRPLAMRVDRHGTEFALCAIPLGGYVKMLDERDEGQDVTVENRHESFNAQLSVEGLMTVFYRNILTFVPLVEHLYITTEWNSAERKLCPVPVHPHGKWTTETNSESQNTDTATTSNPVMPVFMNGDKDSQRHQSHHNRKQHLH